MVAPGSFLMPNCEDWLYLHDLCSCYNTQGNTDGSISITTPSNNQATTVDYLTYKFLWRTPWLPILGFAFYNNGGAAPNVVASGVWTVLATLHKVVDDVMNRSARGSGKPGRRATDQVAIATLTNSSSVAWPGYFDNPVFLEAGEYAWGVRYNPSFNAGEMARGNYQYYQFGTTTPMKIANQGAFNSQMPADISTATFTTWNGGGAGSELVLLGDIVTICARPKTILTLDGIPYAKAA